MWIRIQRYKITDKMMRKAEFNQQQFFFPRKLYFVSLNLKKSRFHAELSISPIVNSQPSFLGFGSDHRGADVCWTATSSLNSYFFLLFKIKRCFENLVTLLTWIRIDQILWIRIRIQSIRIHITAYSACYLDVQLYS